MFAAAGDGIPTALILIDGHPAPWASDQVSDISGIAGLKLKNVRLRGKARRGNGRIQDMPMANVSTRAAPENAGT